MKNFDVARLRLNRAKEHGEAMSNAWNDIPAEQFFRVRAKIDRDGGGSLFVEQATAIPDIFSLLLGEMLYQMRSALDACIYQAAIYATGQNPPPNEGSYEFPITSDAAKFPNLARLKLKDIPQNLQDAIERVQPYNQPPTLAGPDVVKNLHRSLSILNDLARKDRHRKLHVAGVTPSKLDPKFTFPHGVKLKSLTVHDPATLQDQTVLASFQLDGFTPNSGEVQVNPFLLTLPGLDEPPIRCDASDTFPMRIQEMMNAVDSVICAFESYF